MVGWRFSWGLEGGRREDWLIGVEPVCKPDCLWCRGGRLRPAGREPLLGEAGQGAHVSGLAQIHHLGFGIAEVTCPAKYFEEASSINFTRSVRYGFGCLGVGIQYRLSKMGLLSPNIFQKTS
jgi:hypothetical protein